MYRIEIKYDNGDYVNEVLDKQIDIQSKYGITDRAFRRSRDENKFIRSEKLKCAYKGSEVNDEKEEINFKVDFSDLVNVINDLTTKQTDKILTSNTLSAKNILAIGDPHEPFCLDGYLEHCKKIQLKYNCDTVIIMGDLVDNHALSYWESDPDGMSSGEELRKTKEKITKWYEAFPNAYVLYGNHCILPYRKAFSSGLSRHWIKDMKEVLNTPNWIYGEEFIINNILFYHGEGMSPKSKSILEMINVVGAHNHSSSYINFTQGRLPNTRIWSMQVGCGVDSKSYAMQYGKHGKPPQINCGVITGGTPILEYMEV